MAFTDRLHNRGSISTGYDIDNSIMLEGLDSEKIQRTPSSNGNMQMWTVSCWVKRTELATNQMIFSASDTYAYFTNDDILQVNLRSASSGNRLLLTNRVFRDCAAWYHIVVRVDTENSTGTNKCRIYVNGRQETSFSLSSAHSGTGDTRWNNTTSHKIGNYVSSDYYYHGYIAEFHSIDGQSLGPDNFAEENTDGEWVPKEYAGTYGSQGFYLNFKTLGYGTSHRYWKYQAYSTSNHVPRASRIYLIKEDGSKQNFKYYAADNCSDSGGIMAVASGSTTYSDDSNTEYTIDLGSAQNVQGYGFYSSYGSASKNVTAKLYYSDDGSSWTEDESNSISTRSSDACGEYNRYRGTAGLGQDDSGNGNHFTLSNVDTTNQSTDTPTNNFCTLNNTSRTNGNIRTNYGGTYVGTDGGSGWVSMNATMGVSNGKWYWEGQRENNSDGTYVMVGVAGANDPWIPHRAGGYYLGNVATGAQTGWYYLNGTVYNGAGTWTGPSQGDRVMKALDMDNKKLYFGKNGTWQNSSNPATNTNGQGLAWGAIAGATDIVLPTVSVYQGNRTRMNFGGYFRLNQALASGNSDANGYGTFEYEPPSGFYALCSKNLAEFG